MGPSICSEIETVSTAMGSFANLLTPNRRSAHRAPESLAESLRRTSDRLDPQGLPGPFHHLQRAASETNPKFLFHLLPWIEASFRTRQAMSACFGRSRVSERSSRFRTLAVCIAATNARQRNAMPAD